MKETETPGDIPEITWINDNYQNVIKRCLAMGGG